MTSPPTPNRGTMIVLAYLWLLALIPLVLDKQDAEVQWHARHGIVLMVAELVVLLVMTAVATVLSIAILDVGWMASIFGATLWLAAFLLVQIGILALHAFAIARGIRGERLIVPGITGFADRFGQ